ncbi:hypothetical protein DNX02_19545, partial [Escherichia coli]|nr:hypothetical protein [Escherichia coli]EGD9484575.1 hypothetical protein [Escherichia coli]
FTDMPSGAALIRVFCYLPEKVLKISRRYQPFRRCIQIMMKLNIGVRLREGLCQYQIENRVRR